MSKLLTTTGTAVLFALGGALHAATTVDETKLLAGDGAAGDFFGYSVAVAGTTGLVGSVLDDPQGAESGSAYLFDTTTGGQIQTLTPTNGAAGDRFGYSTGISGTTAVVGAFQDDDLGANSGSAFVFDTVTGNQLHQLTASDGATGDQFGYSVAASGTTALVGANLDDDSGTSSGSAYLFDTVTGNQLFKLTAADGASNDRFGWSVAVSGTTALVGANFDDDMGTNSGSAYLFDTLTGDLLFKLTAADGEAGDQFGYSVAISGTTALIGAALDDDMGTDSGSVYVFDITTGLQINKLTASDAAAGDRFGTSVALSGTNAVIGSQYNDSMGADSGAAYLFDLLSGTETAQILASDGAAGDSFGRSVGISGTTAMVGAYASDDDGLSSGSAYVYEISTSEVPLPAGAWLLATALGALAFGRRRKA